MRGMACKHSGIAPTVQPRLSEKLVHPGSSVRMSKRILFSWLVVVTVVSCRSVLPDRVQAQSPELAMREFSSGQIKKGVRSIGFGGDGATWGNYSLVWMDADTALVDYADTHYTNGNDFYFSAVGATTPSLWHHLAIYVIGMFQRTNDIHLGLKSPGFGASAVPVVGSGSDNAVFAKIAMPLGKGFSAGILLSHETSQFDAAAAANSNQKVHYQTEWRPSGGFGVAWQPKPRLLFGFRGLLNNDLERRTDLATFQQGMARVQEYRFGASASPWRGAWIDVGATRLERSNALAHSRTIFWHPNLGFEQTLLNKHLALRFGQDETSPTAGLTLKAARFKLDAAYVDNMARDRVGSLFGNQSRSLLFTFTLDYGPRKPHSPAKSGSDQRHAQAGIAPPGSLD